ncbi:hypothetical protein NDU88_004593 [Pleurodeles waltl]|uniref:Uncharacterized protein n=1 Tax=Pleurodeles waltl TaxID=8319 RepID=A0AAV7LLT5_PLEWA|nr:hypothetical protein NDU88_004593 [Pleurodeles waltl]
MHSENRSPTPGPHPRLSGEDDARPEKGGMVGPTARKMDRGPHRDPTRPRCRDARCNIDRLVFIADVGTTIWRYVWSYLYEDLRNSYNNLGNPECSCPFTEGDAAA